MHACTCMHITHARPCVAAHSAVTRLYCVLLAYDTLLLPSPLPSVPRRATSAAFDCRHPTARSAARGLLALYTSPRAANTFQSQYEARADAPAALWHHGRGVLLLLAESNVSVLLWSWRSKAQHDVPGSLGSAPERKSHPCVFTADVQ